jgi:hypothetical protein
MVLSMGLPVEDIVAYDEKKFEPFSPADPREILAKLIAEKVK